MQSEPLPTPQPGLLIRRLHQIHLALFEEECTGFPITLAQYGILQAAAEHPGLDQAGIKAAAGLDRASYSNGVMRLESENLLRRVPSQLDRREKLLSLTPRGRALLASMREPVARVHARTIAALPPGQREIFMELLGRLVDAGQDYAAVKLR